MDSHLFYILFTVTISRNFQTRNLKFLMKLYIPDFQHRTFSVLISTDSLKIWIIVSVFHAYIVQVRLFEFLSSWRVWVNDYISLWFHWWDLQFLSQFIELWLISKIIYIVIKWLLNFYLTRIQTHFNIINKYISGKWKTFWNKTNNDIFRFQNQNLY